MTPEIQHSVNCPKCRSHKVRMTNPLGLAEQAYDGQPYLFDNEAYATGTCDNCGHSFSVQGEINWKQHNDFKRYDTLQKYPQAEKDIRAAIDKLYAILNDPSHLCDVGCTMTMIGKELTDSGKTHIDVFYAEQKEQAKRKNVTLTVTTSIPDDADPNQLQENVSLALAYSNNVTETTGGDIVVKIVE